MLVISTFRVVNGIEEQVREAFRNRPHLVDDAPGFLGMEVLTSSEDPATFHLHTWWVDADSYRSWHRSHAHFESHALIPRGLKLDPRSTSLRLFELVEGDDALVRDSADLLARLTTTGAAILVARLDRSGTVLSCNDSLARALGAPRDALVGKALQPFLARASLNWLTDQLASGAPDRTPRLINLVDVRGEPVSIRGLAQRRAYGLLLVAEPALESERSLQGETLAINGRLAVLIQENQRQAAELAMANAKLEDAHRELKDSYWHLRKVQEILPFCMSCHRVKEAQGTWGDVAEFLKKHSNFLSHSYCPACALAVRKEWEIQNP